MVFAPTFGQECKISMSVFSFSVRRGRIRATLTHSAVHCGQSSPLKKPRQEISHEGRRCREKIQPALSSSEGEKRLPLKYITMLFFIGLSKVLTSPGKHLKTRTTE